MYGLGKSRQDMLPPALAPAMRAFMIFHLLAFVAAIAIDPAPFRPLVVTVFTLSVVIAYSVPPLPHPRGAGYITPVTPVLLTAAVLWSPAEVLIGTVLGIFLSYTLLRGKGDWRALANCLPGSLHAWAAAMTIASLRSILPHSPEFALIFALLAVLVLGFFNTVNGAIYRSIRLGHPLFVELRHAWAFPSWWVKLWDVVPVSALVALAWRDGTQLTALVATLGALLAVPITRWLDAIFLERGMRARATQISTAEGSLRFPPANLGLAQNRELHTLQVAPVEAVQPAPSTGPAAEPVGHYFIWSPLLIAYSGVLLLANVFAVVVSGPTFRFPVVATIAVVFFWTALLRPVPYPGGGGFIAPTTPVALIAAVLWSPAEVLVGVVLGSIVRLAVTRTTSVVGRVGDALIWPLGPWAASVSTSALRAALPHRYEAIPIIVLAAIIINGVINTIMYNTFRSIRLRRPFIQELRYSYNWSFASWLVRLWEIVPVSALTALAWWNGQLIVGLAATAGALLAVPVTRWMDLSAVEHALRNRADRATREAREVAEAAPVFGDDRFHTLTADITEGIALLSAEGTLLYISPSGGRLLGYEAIDVLGSSWLPGRTHGLGSDGAPWWEGRGRTWFHLHHPDDVARARAAILAVEHAPGRPESADVRVRHADGTYRILHTIYVNRIMQPTVQAIVVTFRDITDQVRAEDTIADMATRLQDASRQLVQAEENERRRIARELHDDVGQSLTALRMTLNVAMKDAKKMGAAPVQASLTDAEGIMDALQRRLRTVLLTLRSTVLDDRGLLAAALSHCEEFTVHTNVRVDVQHRHLEDRRFPPEVETTAYRILQEALTNVARHAHAREATVRLWVDATQLGVQVEDRGCGFDPDTALRSPRSHGLAGMRERVELLQGRLTIDSAPGQGTRVTAELPLSSALEHTPTDA